MGLAASQGRYLCLTARMSDLVYEAQQISQQRMFLAKETKAVADEYNEAISNRILQANIHNKDGEIQAQLLTYANITSKDPFSGVGMRIVDENGNVVVPPKKHYLDVTTTNEDSTTSTIRYEDPKAFVDEHFKGATEEEKEEYYAMSLYQLQDIYNEKYKEENVSIEYKTNIDPSLKNDDESYLYDEFCTDAQYLQNMLLTGKWFLQEVNPKSESGWEEIVWQGSTKISNVLDTSDDAAAEAKYEAAMKDLQQKDKLLELRLEQIQTEQNSVETEIESIKGVISKNIEDSFGTFA
ncbi:MAG: hypothetical protein E7Z90_00360 [Cyanobacteria bacterium SIG29]|nr:hypothetical protein [Cyanobacteria bacterium SIG29]